MSNDQSQKGLPPAYFLSLTLENVRCFGPEQTLDLTDDEGRPAQWTVLLGDNGTGKTTLLQAIAGMQTTSSFTIEEGGETKIEPILTFGDEPFHSWRRKASRSPSLLRLEISVGFSNDLNTRKEEMERRGKLKMTTHSSNFLPERASINCIAYGAARRMGDQKFDASERASVVGLFSESEEGTPDAEKWLRELDYAAKSGKRKAKKRRDQVERILADPEIGILPDVDDLRFTEQKGDYSAPRVEFHTPYGWVTIDQLSLGYRTMIAWLVDLARRLFDRYPESDSPIKEPAVCLVDEIDLHLHPKWQRKIIEFLGDRFENTQFIVTAHSPLVVQAAENANIALMKRVEVEDGEDYVNIENDPARIRNWRVDQILTSDLFDLESARPPQVDKLMREREKILAKEELTEEDEKQLNEIEEKMGDLPTGETPDDIEAMNLIRRAARRLDEES